MKKYYINQLMEAKQFESQFELLTDDKGLYTTDKEFFEWLTELDEAILTLKEYGFDFKRWQADELQSYIDKAHEFDDGLTVENITRSTIERYLENYRFTTSVTMDSIFKRFKSDVYALAEEVRKNEAYVYDIDDYIAEIKDIYADVMEEWEVTLEQLEDALEYGYTVVIDRYGELEFI